MRTSRKKQGFTLIELLVVVAVIAILAAIAIPHLLEAQTRSKVSRAKADLRTVANAIQIYQLDWNNLPISNNDPNQLNRLTTPIAYISSNPWDVFFPGEQSDTFYQLHDPAEIKVFAHDFFSSLRNNDLDSIEKMCTPPHPWEELQQYVEKVAKHYSSIEEVLFIGEPFKKGKYPGVYVPYKLRYEDGHIKEWNLALK